MSGFIVIQRAAGSHYLLSDSAKLGAWVSLIMMAAWKPIPYDIKGKTITLQRGQLCASRSQLAKAWGWSPSAVERFLTRLQTEQMIERETGQGRSVITITNYDTYQSKEREAGQASGQCTGQQSDSNRTAKEQGNKGTIIPNGMNNTVSAREAFPCPDWCEPEVWRDLKANRKQKRLANTPTAHSQFVREVMKLADDSWPPGEVVRQIVARGWGGAYDPRQAGKNKPNGRGGSLRDIGDEVRGLLGNG